MSTSNSSKKLSKVSTPIMGSIKNKIVASDLQEEREKCDFDKYKGEGLGAMIDQAQIEMYEESVKFMESDPVLLNTHKYYEMTRKETWIQAMQKTRRAYELGKERWFHQHIPGNLTWAYVHLGQNITTMSYTMFLQTIQAMATDEQKSKWLPLTREMKIIGCYAQTELGHGSYVQGLETTATFDQQNDQFIINTPTITATKWWPGDLGQFASHAIVFANLIIDENSYGVMPFIVQLRDTETWIPLPGVECGDMGPKLGYNSKNNGWCTFDNVKISRDQMLMKYVSVDKDGSFSIEGDLRVLYSVMMDIRLSLLQVSANSLRKGLLIAIRYSCVRRQFRNTSGMKLETKLIDYQTQQMKLIPLMCQSYSFFFCHSYIANRYKQLLNEVIEGNFNLLDELHHLTSGMKSIFTQVCNDGLLQIRQSVGGAGYSAWSGIPYLIEDSSPLVTFEGDNTVMAQQSARFLIKLYKKAQNGQILEGVWDYINELDLCLKKVCIANTAQQFTNNQQIDEALKFISCYVIDSTNKKMNESNESKLDQTNRVFGLDIVTMAQLHLKYLNFKIMQQNLSKIACEKLRGHFLNMNSLLGLTYLQEYKANGYDSGYFQKGAQSLIDEAVKILLLKIRPQIIPLIEIFDIPDSIIVSAIGNSYGDIYETHLEWAKDSKLNKTKGNIPQGFDVNLMPILKGKL